MNTRRRFFSALAGAVSGTAAAAVTPTAPKTLRLELGTYPVCKCGGPMIREERDGSQVFRACCYYKTCDNYGKLFEIPTMELRQMGSVTQEQLDKEYAAWKTADDKYREELRQETADRLGKPWTA